MTKRQKIWIFPKLLMLHDSFMVIMHKHKHNPSNKSEEFPQILQPWWLSLKNFWGISWESFSVTDSSEILKKFPRIGPQDERFLWDHRFETLFWEIPEKFLGLGYHVYRFFGKFIKRICFKKFPGISPEFHPKKILKISPDYFSGNSQEILGTWSPCLRIFREIY